MRHLRNLLYNVCDEWSLISRRNYVLRNKQFIGGKPMYGYKMHPTEKNKIVIDEEVAPVVRRIFAMALDGMS